MISIEREEKLARLNDSELVKYAMKHLKMAYDAKGSTIDHSGEEKLQDILDGIFMECLDRDKEWIFDKAQEGCFKGIAPSCTVPRSSELA